MIESGWLVERGEKTPMYFGSCGRSDRFIWSCLADEAIRFARKCDAEVFMRGIKHHINNTNEQTDYDRITEHQWETELDLSDEPNEGDPHATAHPQEETGKGVP